MTSRSHSTLLQVKQHCGFFPITMFTQKRKVVLYRTTPAGVRKTEAKEQECEAKVADTASPHLRNMKVKKIGHLKRISCQEFSATDKVFSVSRDIETYTFSFWGWGGYISTRLLAKKEVFITNIIIQFF